jgi:undecaprenyl diphosphate synthase
MSAGHGVMPLLHVAIIMDGNGRWATSKGLPRVAGHRRGAEAVRRVVEAAPRLGVGTLTLYAFSADNWKRPAGEVDTLMSLFERFLCEHVARAVSAGVRISLVGRRDRLTASLLAAVEEAEERTAAGAALHLRLAIDYSAREAIWLSARRLHEDGEVARERFAARVRSGSGDLVDVPDVDLLIRSGGEQRLSDFLLWESAYAELWFTDVAWPDFAAADLESAVAAFARRERRFGALPGDRHKTLA